MIITNLTKQAHPIASKIPNNIWVSVFNERLDDSELKLGKKQFNEIKRIDLPKNDSQALTVLILCYPDTPFSEYMIRTGIKPSNQAIFSISTNMGCLKSLNYLQEKARNKLITLIEANDYRGFRVAAANGHLDVLKELKKVTPLALMKMSKANDFGAFRLACENGHLNTLKWLLIEAFNQSMPMIEASNYHAFRGASENGHLDILIWLKSLAPNALQNMIQASNYYAFRWACANGHLNTIKWLKDQAPDEFLAIIEAEQYDAFRKACANGHLDTVTWLLRHPTCFAYIEQHEHEYGHQVHPFRQNMLAALHQESQDFLIQNPNAAFDIQESERARLCFYLMRNLIRHNNRLFDEELRFLLSIPSVKALAHQELTIGHPNELLWLAQGYDNSEALILLLNIDAVRRLAEANNFYRPDIRYAINLRRLAQDKESAMTALSADEAKRLHAASELYQPWIIAAGIEAIIEDLKETLKNNYETQPACINVDDTLLSLPVEYFTFKGLGLTVSDFNNALIAYYKHPTHTALRYLSKPNHWMHPNAAFVLSSEETAGLWSYFEDYQPLIALLYLAATDTQIALDEGYTPETRFTHFIEELALIGRAHNWDKTRTRNALKEQYDDLEADRPSCYSGVKRRLFQSVVGHPLFDILSDDKIEVEIRQFAFTHFESVITESNKHALKKVFDACFEDLDESCVDTLACFNIPNEAQEDFIHYLIEKYGSQFSENEAFISQVRDTLSINPEEENSRFRYHALKLIGLTGLYDFLESACKKETHSIGFFAQNQEPKETVPEMNSACKL